jgi:histone H3/H4
MAAKKKMDPLIVASKAKAALKGMGCNTSGDALDALNGYAGWLIDQAAKRAKANGRKTVRAHDFMIM